MSDMLSLLSRYGYLVVFGVLLLENLGLPLPGLALLIVAGAFAAAGSLWIPLIILAGVSGAIIGDLVWYGLGRWRGRPVLGWLCRLSLNPDTCIGKTEQFFLRHGMPTLLIAKFLPGVNTIAPPLMGTLRARLGSFLAYDMVGALLFTLAGVGLGYLVGWEMVDRAGAAISQLGVLFAWGIAGFMLAYITWRLTLRLRVRRALRTSSMTPAELKTLRKNGDVVILDVRSPLAVKENPKIIAGAIRVGLDELDRFAASLLLDQAVVTYCV